MTEAELRQRIAELEAEVEALKVENTLLRQGISAETPKATAKQYSRETQAMSMTHIASITKFSPPDEKIELYMSLFRGRTDVYALNRIKRLAAFQNPQFYKTQRMRMSTYGIPRIISSLDETADYVGLPRGCKPALAELLTQAGVSVKFEDKRNAGTSIPVRFTGVLREEQQLAADALLQHDNGTLSLPTAFGKTVIGAALINEKKCNTLILVHLQTLLAQWKRSLEQFLVIETVSQEKKRKPRSAIGQTGQGRNTATGIVDIANH